MAEGLHVGTSGWHYDYWQGPFYPQDLPSGEWLAHYAEHLPTVEVNNSFYQLPEAETLRAWRATTPDEFVFAVKASRLASMEAAEKNIREQLEELNARYHTLRQNSITEELMDVVAGYQVLSEDR